MNSSDLQADFPVEYDVGGVHPAFHAFVIAFGGSLAYLSYFKNKRLPSLPCPTDAFVRENPPQKDLSQPYLEPLPKFSYSSTPPLKFRPYKSAFLHTMGFQPNPVEDLILLDKTYRQRLAYRRNILICHPSETYGHISAATSAVSELYTYIFSHHLPTRFPRHFSKSPSGTLVQNHTTTNTYPIIAQSASNALRALGENLDEDYTILLPDDENVGAWKVGAFVVCFPGGSNMAAKLGCPIGDDPTVPEFERKLEGLDKCLGLLPPGVENGVRRLKWTISRSSELYTPNGMHVYHGKDDCEKHEIDLRDCCLRVERQTLWKLPLSGAVVSSIKTYMYPLSEIKSEGPGETALLADAIEAMGDSMGRYKERDVWGKQVLDYLRS